MNNALSAAPATSLLTSAASRFVRGGRVTKWKGKVASIAPDLASLAGVTGLSAQVSPLALALALGGALLGAATPAAAGSCTVGPLSTCSGPAGADVTQTISAAPGTPIVVTTNPGFGITTAAGNGINMIANSGVTFIDNNSSAIQGGVHGIFANTDPATNFGVLNITTSGVVTGVTGNGIDATHLDTSKYFPMLADL